MMTGSTATEKLPRALVLQLTNTKPICRSEYNSVIWPRNARPLTGGTGSGRLSEERTLAARFAHEISTRDARDYPILQHFG